MSMDALFIENHTIEIVNQIIGIVKICRLGFYQGHSFKFYFLYYYNQKL